MKNLKHTQGNWDYSTSLGEISITGVSTDIALVNTGTSINYDEARANAKLIAAAPELLESLISLKERLNYLISTGRVDINKTETIRDINIANDAIKKATS